MALHNYFNTGIANYRKWNETEWSQYQLAAWYRWNKEDWWAVKKILLHKNCPQTIRDRYANSKIWWQRIPAMLCKHVRHMYWDKAIKDRHRFVRKCAYSGSHWGMKKGYEVPLGKILELIYKDKEVQRDSRYKATADEYVKIRDLAVEELAMELLSPDEWNREIARYVYDNRTKNR